jgi:hypothetical protein
MTLPARARAASWLLACVLPASDVEHVVGDLEEELASRPSRRWYWGQLARSFPRLVCLPIRRSGWVATCGVALAACAVQATIELIVGMALYRFAATSAPWPGVASVALTFSSLLVVSREAARLRPGAATVLAAVAAAAGTSRVLLGSSADGRTPFVMLVGLVVVPALAFAGGILALRRPSGRIL